MSVVTNLIFSFDILENEADVLAHASSFTNPMNSRQSTIFSEHSMDACGGDKHMERPTYLAACNHLPVDKFIEHLMDYEFEYPEHVQLFVCGQHEDKYTEMYQGYSTPDVIEGVDGDETK